jgi:tRNA(Ile)-lysidine synthase TilS/MesJ
MIRAGDPVIAAVSGGADSVCLGHALREACVGVVGLANGNHKLRGMVDE